MRFKGFIIALILLYPFNLFAEWSFKDVGRHLGNDLKESVWGYQALILGVGAVAAGSLYTQDDEVNDLFVNNQPISGSYEFFNQLGYSYTLGGISVLTWGVGEIFDAPKVSLTGEAMVEALFLSQAFTGFIKISADRARPDGSDNLSFPSSHASGTFSIATVLEVMHGPLIGIPSYVLAGLCGFARMGDNKHWLSDITFGAALGTAIGYGTAKFHKKENPNLFFSPMVGQDMYGIGMTYLF